MVGNIQAKLTVADVFTIIGLFEGRPLDRWGKNTWGNWSLGEGREGNCLDVRASTVCGKSKRMTHARVAMPPRERG